MATCSGCYSELPPLRCPEEKPCKYQVQVIDPGKIVMNGTVYEISGIDNDWIKFQSGSLREMHLHTGIYGRLMADHHVFGSRILEMGIMNGRLVYLKEVNDHLKKAILALDKVDERLGEIGEQLKKAWENG